MDDWTVAPGTKTKVLCDDDQVDMSELLTSSDITPPSHPLLFLSPQHSVLPNWNQIGLGMPASHWDD